MSVAPLRDPSIRWHGNKEPASGGPGLAIAWVMGNAEIVRL